MLSESTLPFTPLNEGIFQIQYVDNTFIKVTSSFQKLSTTWSYLFNCIVK